MSKLFSFPLNQNNSAMARYGREGEGGTGRACRGGKGGGQRHKGVTLVSPQVKRKQCMVKQELAKKKQSKKGMLIGGRVSLGKSLS